VIVGSTTTQYLYDALGQLVQKTVGGTATLLMYDRGGSPVRRVHQQRGAHQETIWMGDIPVATLRPNGSSISIYYVETDQLNAPRVITRTDNHYPMWRWIPIHSAPLLPIRIPYGYGTFIYNLRFPGQYYQSETGLYYNYFRDYDPQTGRYIESDPIGLRGGINTYGFVGANPIQSQRSFWAENSSQR